jgi:phage gp29-like protein
LSRADLFRDAASAVLSGIEDVINQSALSRLMALNGIAESLWPRFVFNEVTKRDTKTFADMIVALTTAGVVDGSDPAVRQHVYDELGLPMPQEIDEETTAEDPTAEPDEPPPPEPPARLAAVEMLTHPVDEATKAANERAIEAFNRIVGPKLAGLLEAEVELSDG